MFHRNWIQYIILTLLLIESCVFVSECAIAGTTHRHSVSPNREREADGAYSPRSANHYGKVPGSSEHKSEFDHEAILGSAKDAEEFDNLSPAEAKRRLRILIEKMDFDKNGFVERSELKAWIIRSFRMLSEEESKERFEEVDSDEDGRVSWLEFIEETFGVHSDENELPIDNLDEKRMMADDKALFEAADRNKDKYLDRIEYLSFTHPEEDPLMIPIILQQTLIDKDKNGDGEIDFKEYIGDRAKDKDQEWLNEEKSRFDTEHDKDGDGLLNRQEILSWVIPSNEEISEEEVVHLFVASDDDHDNRLSYSEILDHHDVFVGSEATDYGDHLHFMERFTDEL